MDQMQQLEACRICATCFSLKDMDFINIFQPNEEFQQEINFIQGEIRQWQLKIQPNDGLPQKICANCFSKFCSIQAFCKECELAQKKLVDTLTQESINNEPDVRLVIKNTEAPLPLVGNYGNSSDVLSTNNNVLVSSVNLTQNDLNDFTVFDQQFLHYDNPELMDTSSTLLDSNLISSETTQELGFLPSQNLFTFETTEPPSTGTLSLDETETTSIMNEILVEKPANTNDFIKHDDLEDMLQHSIIPTKTKLTQQTSLSCVNNQQQDNSTNTTAAKLEQDSKNNKKNQFRNSQVLKLKNECQSTSVSILNREDTSSDIECDDSDVHARLKGLPYACHYCFCPETGSIDHLIFPNEDALSKHFFDVHDPNRLYTCPKCPQTCKTKLLRDNHIRLVHETVELQTCSYCRKRLNGSIEVHQYNCQYIGDWQCQQCKEQFLKTPLYRFRLHQRKHESTRQFNCRLCERSFVKKANFEAHQRMHKAEAQSTHTCTQCKAIFIDEYELKRHEYQLHNGEPPAKCKFCNKGFSTKVFLQRHLNQIHSGNKTNNKNKNASSSATSSSALPSSQPHICLYCNMGFKTLLKLQQHLLLGRDKNGNCVHLLCNRVERRKLQRQGVFPCFHCPRRFHLRSQLDKHLNTHDARLRPFQCEKCVMRCRTPFELKQHVNVAHLNIKAFSCDKCGKCFGYKKDLRDHMLFHAEINVHCTEEGCDYACKNEKALNDHIRHKHRLLSCEYCHEQFTRQKLTAHLRNTHRTEIDIQLACESDTIYKSQLLNNNNDISQMSFNLLNTQQQENKLLSTSPPPTSVSSPILTTAVDSVQPQTKTFITTASSSPSSLALLPTSFTATPPSDSVATSSLSSSSTTSLSSPCLAINTKGTDFSSNSNSISSQNMIADVDHHHRHHQNQISAIYASVSQDSNVTTLPLNGLVSNGHDLNLVTNDTTNMFLVTPTSSSTNDNQLDHYFMASLIDAEQEIIVT